MTKSVPEYRVWIAMRQRCYLKSSKAYADYGGRGITVCARWDKSFTAFISDMGRRPSPKHTIERIDNNQGYRKSNCRWATHSEQMRNRRTTLTAIIDGVKRPIIEWAELHGLTYWTIKTRYDRGARGAALVASPEQAKAAGLLKKKTNVMLEFNGKRMPMAWWAREVGIKTATLRRRLEYSWPLEQALSAEMHKGGRNKTS